MRRFLAELERRGLLRRWSSPVSTEHEVALLLKRNSSTTMLFERPAGYSIPIIGNLLASRSHLQLVMGPDTEAYQRLLHAMRNPTPLTGVPMPSHYREVGNLSSLPVLKSYEGEAGRYITSSIVIARDPETRALNASIHRMLVLDDRHLAVRIVPRHLYKMYESARRLGRDLPVNVVIGASPEVYLAAAASPPYGVFELEVANTLMKGELNVFYSENGLPAPVEAEIVVEGRLLAEGEAWEGPFVDITGTLDIARRQPILEVDRVLIRGDAYYYAILQGGPEHMLLMGFPREAAIWDSVRSVVPRVKAVRLTRGGCGWLIAVISLSKSCEGDPKNALLAAFSAHPSLKIAIAVDEDINVDDMEEVFWAMATRMQPDEDLLIISRARGSSLDPSADQERLLTSKLGIDATIPMDKRREDFLKASIPEVRHREQSGQHVDY